MPEINEKRDHKFQNIAIRISISIGLFLFSIGLFVVFYKHDSASKIEFSVTPIKENYPEPDLTLEDMNARKVSITDFQGKVVLVNNWATWCPPCKAELPTLQKYYQTQANQGFIILAIEAGDPRNQIEELIERFSLSFPVLQDPSNLSMKVFGNWDLPSSYVIDRSGQVRLSWTGQISIEMLNKYVTPLLKEEN